MPLFILCILKNHTKTLKFFFTVKENFIGNKRYWLLTVNSSKLWFKKRWKEKEILNIFYWNTLVFGLMITKWYAKSGWIRKNSKKMISIMESKDPSFENNKFSLLRLFLFWFSFWEILLIIRSWIISHRGWNIIDFLFFFLRCILWDWHLSADLRLLFLKMPLLSW